LIYAINSLLDSINMSVGNF